MTTTTQIREWWSPACKGPFVKVELHGEGAVSVNEKIIPAVLQLNAQLKKHNYLTRLNDTGAYKCRTITGGTGYSLHAYGIALDLNWKTNPYGPTLITDMPPAMIADIKAIKTRNGKQVWRWGGNYSGNKDAMHFEIIVSPADLATGIATPSPSIPTTPTTPSEDDMPALLLIKGDLTDPWWITDGMMKRYCATGEHAGQLAFAGLLRWNEGGPFVVPQNMVDRIPTAPEDGVPGHLGVKSIVETETDKLAWTLGQVKESVDNATPGSGVSETKIREILNEEFGFLKPGK